MNSKIDSYEQPIERHSEYQEQKKYYSAFARAIAQRDLGIACRMILGSAIAKRTEGMAMR